MESVGVRDLKNNLSAYLRKVAAGEIIRVTDRGRLVAELRPPAPVPNAYQDRPPLFWEKVARGELKPASTPNSPDFYQSLPTSEGYPKGTARTLIDDDRRER